MRRLFRVVDPALFVLGTLVVLALATCGGRLAYQRWFEPYTIVVATGGRSGESYLLGEALEDVLERRFANVDLVVRETRGTDENLRLLGDGEAHLAFAQADVVTDYADALDTRDAALVTVLFADLFQLLTCREGEATFEDVLADLRDPARVETVYLTVPRAGEPSGGQLASFLRLGQHFRLDGAVRLLDQPPDGPPPSFYVRDNHDPRDDNSDGRPDGLFAPNGELAYCNADHAGDLIFRVRIAGNEEIQTALERGWRLVGLVELGALQLENGALEPAMLPAGAYRVEGRPAPAQDLHTLAVHRLLLSRAGALPDWFTHELARTLNEDGQTLADAVLQRARGDNVRERYARDHVAPMLARVRSHNDPETHAHVGVPLDPGALGYYSPNESWFSALNAYADGVALALTIAGIFGTGVFGLNRLLVQIRKNTADSYIARVGFLERYGVRTPRSARTPDERALADALHTTVSTTPAPTAGIDDAWQSLVEGKRKLELLSDVFAQAGRALGAEAISQESYRTFTEAHAAAKEVVSQQMEEARRRIVLIYVNRLMMLLETPDRGTKDLDPLLIEASAVLRNDLVFSRESFRTFTDAYTVVIGEQHRRG